MNLLNLTKIKVDLELQPLIQDFQLISSNTEENYLLDSNTNEEFDLVITTITGKNNYECHRCD